MSKLISTERSEHKFVSKLPKIVLLLLTRFCTSEFFRAKPRMYDTVALTPILHAKPLIVKGSLSDPVQVELFHDSTTIYRFPNFATNAPDFSNN